jgi:1,2-phenylacetyl-CoA epoxidase PaaB subunit
VGDGWRRNPLSWRRYTFHYGNSINLPHKHLLLQGQRPRPVLRLGSRLQHALRAGLRRKALEDAQNNVVRRRRSNNYEFVKNSRCSGQPPEEVNEGPHNAKACEMCCKCEAGLRREVEEHIVAPKPSSNIGRKCNIFRVSQQQHRKQVQNLKEARRSRCHGARNDAIEA